MAVAVDGGMDPVLGFALVGVLGVGAQWLAWRLRMPAIVLMLAAGLIVGPVLGWFHPSETIGPLLSSMVSVAVAIILFEGGMSLNLHSLREATEGVKRLVLLGAPIGWLLSALALHYVAGLSWATSATFGGILIVTGPTVIAPLLRQARLDKRPAQLLQWEAIINDPLGALAAVLAFEFVLVMNTSLSMGAAIMQVIFGIAVATVAGIAAGYGLSEAFRRAKVPEYMKIPVLFAAVLAVFAGSNAFLHESGLLAVTVMGIWMANADLPSYTELRRFKEHATILLVSGVFILLAADMKIETLAMLDWRAFAFIAAIVLLVRPLTVLISLAFTNVPMRERILVGFTGPRGVVLVAVAGFFATQLDKAGIEDGARLVPLAFALVAATVVLHGFSLAPMARALGLAGHGTPGVIMVGGNPFSVALGKELQALDVPVLISDRNRSHLRKAAHEGLRTFTGDILSEAAETGLPMSTYGTLIALSDNDAYNTLVTTDFAPELGRENVLQLKRPEQERARHALPSSLGGRILAKGLSYDDIAARMVQGWTIRVTGLTEDFGIEEWRATNGDGIAIARLGKNNDLTFFAEGADLKAKADTQLIWLGPERDKENEKREKQAKKAD